MLANPTPMEKNAEKQVDQVAAQIAVKLGLKEVPWYRLTLYITGIYTLVILLSLFYRADFFSVSLN